MEGKLAFPGGLVHVSESVDEAARRHLQNKAGIEGFYLEQLYTFGGVDRDPFGRVISVAYYALVPANKVTPHSSSRYQDAEWISVSDVKEMAYDHKQILQTALERLRNKLGYTNIIYSLLPQEFTLSELQEMYEIILGHSLDKRNFRKKVLSLDLVKETPHKRGGLASRPAQLYKFLEHKPTIVEIL